MDMNIERLRRYEIYVILQPDLDADQLEARIDRINGYLTGHKGDIIEVARKGKRRLIYPIQKFKQGIDVIYQVELPSRHLGALERQFNLNEDIIRYLIVRLEDVISVPQPEASADAQAAEVAVSNSDDEMSLDEFDSDQPVMPIDSFDDNSDANDISWD